MWALNTEGVLYRLSPCASARPIAWCRIPTQQAGWNRCVATDVASPRAAVRGSVLLVPDHSGVYAISLVQPEVFSQFKHPANAELVANTAAQQCPYFRSIAANAEFCSFLARSSSDPHSSRLVVRYFHPERVAEEPFELDSTAVLGPVVRDDSIAVCNREEVHIYSTIDQTVHSFSLPAAFEPYFQRPSQLMNIPINHIPLAVKSGQEGWQAWIGGTYHSRAGVLEVRIQGGYHDFHAAAEGACLCAVEGGLALNQLSSVEFFGLPRPAGRFAGLQPGMPVGFNREIFCCFQATDSALQHRITLYMGEAEPLALSFGDTQCNENSCASFHWLNRTLLVGYHATLAELGGQRGVKFARWSIS